MTIVFVYGTLKRGYGNNRVMQRHDAEFIEEARTTRRFHMAGRGFPIIRPGDDEMAGQVNGELWKVNAECLEDLDRLEGNGHMYQRQLVAVRAASGKLLFAEGYVWLQDMRQGPLVRPAADGSHTWSRSY